MDAASSVELHQGRSIKRPCGARPAPVQTLNCRTQAFQSATLATCRERASSGMCVWIRTGNPEFSARWIRPRQGGPSSGGSNERNFEAWLRDSGGDRRITTRRTSPDAAWGLPLPYGGGGNPARSALRQHPLTSSRFAVASTCPPTLRASAG
jgi:hypothetical protein